MKNVEFFDIYNVKVGITPHHVVLEGTAEDESSRKIVFKSFQGIKLITIDCYDVAEDYWPGERNVLIEIKNSKWLDEMRKALKNVDSTADFLDESKHYMLIGYDIVFEIIAPGWEWREASGATKLEKT